MEKKIISGKTILLNTATNTTFIAGDIDQFVQTGTRENDKHIEWAGELDIPVVTGTQIFEELFHEIKHGDKDHEEWLLNKIKDFLKQKGFYSPITPTTNEQKD